MTENQRFQLWTDRARQIATMAHDGQKRKNGEPYIIHPYRVADKAPLSLKPIAWLHDVCEDTHITLQNLYDEGFPAYVINAVDLLTHRSHDNNMTYWSKILTNPEASIVKVLDIQDNLGDTPSKHAIIKYGIALDLFKKHGYSV